MWLPNEITAAVTHLARIHYVSVEDCRIWNANRRDGELRLLTGWCWSERRGEQRYRQGFKIDDRLHPGCILSSRVGNRGAVTRAAAAARGAL